MQPSPFSLNIYRGDSGRWRFAFFTDTANTQPADLTGVTAKSQIRDKPGGAQITNLICTVTLPNIVDVQLAATDSQLLPAKGAWDLQLTYVSGQVSTPAAGPVTVTPDVTDSIPGGLR
jgi:hypothetical protein